MAGYGRWKLLFRQTNPISRNRFVITGLEGVLGIGRFRRGAAGVAEFGDLLLRGLQHGDQGCVFLRGLLLAVRRWLWWRPHGQYTGWIWAVSRNSSGFHGWLMP